MPQEPNKSDEYALATVTAFQSFVATHPDLWARIGETWMASDMGLYRGLRESVCLVGGFTTEQFEAEVRGAFG